MSLQQVINYDNAANFAFDPAKLEQVGSLIQIKKNADFYADYTGNIKDARYGAGSLTGTLVGVAVVQNGFMEAIDAFGATVGAIQYPGAGNASNAAQKGTIRLAWLPQYNNGPLANGESIFFVGTSGVTNNRIELTHAITSNKLFLNLTDSGAVSIGVVELGVFNPTFNQEIEVELNYDLTAGVTRLFLDGVQFGSTINLTGTRAGAAINVIRLGTGAAGTLQSPQMKVRWLALFDSVQHTASYTPIGVLPATQFALESSIVPNAGQLMDALEGLEETTVNAPAGTSLSYIINVDGVDKWFSGVWVNSNGTAAESNTAAEVNTNKAALDLSSGASVKLKTILTSDGVTQASITTHTVDFDFTVPDLSPPNTCIVFGNEVDGGGDPRQGVKVTAKLIDGFNHTTGNYVTISEVERTSDVLGKWDMPLVETASDSKSWLFFKEHVSDDGTLKRETLGPFTVPDETTKRFDLLVDA